MKQIHSVILFSAMLFLTMCKGRNSENLLAEKQSEVNKLVLLLNTRPDSTGLRLVVAGKLDSIGEYKNSLLQIDTLISNDSSKYGLWLSKANILQDSGNTDEAKYYLRKAVAIYPGNEALMGLCELLANEENDSCLLLSKHFNDQTNVYRDYIAALYFYNKDSVGKADSLTDKCILHDHDFVKPYLLKGKICLQIDQTKNALNIFDKALKIEPKNISLLNGIANAFIQTKQSDSAKAYYLKSLAVQPFQPKVSEQIKSLK